MPDEIPKNRGEYIRMMGDLMVLAFQTDQTRVASLMVGPERWETPQLYDGVFDRPVNHHMMTHDSSQDEPASCFLFFATVVQIGLITAARYK